MDELAPSRRGLSQPKPDADLHTTSSVHGQHDRPAGPLQEALSKYTKLPAHRQDQVNKRDFEGYNLEYISNMLKFKSAIAKLFKY